MGFLDFLKRGPRKKLCARCGQQAGDFEFFEICSPHDEQEGLVLPTAY